MKHDRSVSDRIDYAMCDYGTSKLRFRGPKRSLSGPYIAILGGTETFGRFVPSPFAARLETLCGLACVNFGVVNAGVDAFVHDPTVLDAARGAQVTILQVMGAQNLSNRLYRVHPRRNDGFLAPSRALRTLFPETDFVDFNFNRHMLVALATSGADRFHIVVDELRLAWVSRMHQLITAIDGPVVLLWMAETPPPPERQSGQEIGADPLFVTVEMIDELRPRLAGVAVARSGIWPASDPVEGLRIGQTDRAAAEALPGQSAHAAAAAALLPFISKLLHP